MYRNLKEKYRQFLSDLDYQDLFKNFLLVLFEYDDRIYRPDIMEDLLHDLGICALIETDTAKYTPVICYLAGGERYADGLFKHACCYDARGNEYNFDDWRNNENICVIFNTPNITCDKWIYKHAMMLTNIDTSIDSNVVFSRYKPIPIAHDSKTKNQIDTCLLDLQTGKISTILEDANFKMIVDGVSSIDKLDLTDVTKSQYIQYLLHAHDSIFSRACMLMGVDITDNGKQAQITTDELNRHEDVSKIMPIIWYKSRKQAFDKAGLKFDYSEFVKSRFEKTEGEQNESTGENQLQEEDTEAQEKTKKVPEEKEKSEE